MRGVICSPDRTREDFMRLTRLACFAFAMSGVALAQTQAPPTSGMESRYVTACQKEDSMAYCRCEFQSVARVVQDPKDVAFLVQLEEDTAGKPNEETDKIIGRLPKDRQEWVRTMQQQLSPLVKACPDYGQHHH
jgi:hypothetical protein